MFIYIDLYKYEKFKIVYQINILLYNRNRENSEIKKIIF